MKTLLFTIIALVSFSSFAQTINGVTGDQLNNLDYAFEFSITAKSGEIDLINRSLEFSTNKSPNLSVINCSQSSIHYKNRLRDFKTFKLENNDMCNLVLACLNNLEKAEVITIFVDRKKNEVFDIRLPGSCTIDTWASAPADDLNA